MRSVLGLLRCVFLPVSGKLAMYGLVYNCNVSINLSPFLFTTISSSFEHLKESKHSVANKGNSPDWAGTRPCPPPPSSSLTYGTVPALVNVPPLT